MSLGTFKFNFGGTSETVDEDQACPAAPATVCEPRDVVVDVSKLGVVHIPVPGAANLELYKVNIGADEAALYLGQTDVHASDLVPGKYEGGFKVWEGALDLARVLGQRYSGPWHPAEGAGARVAAGAQRRRLQDARVLELGSGHGLPGIVALLAGARVTFHDFNAAVLEMATHVNAEANMQRHGVLCKHSPVYIAGDFRAVCEHLRAGDHFEPFDCILTSETTYNLESAKQILDGCSWCLATDGVLYVAAKTHYFGVGGGLAAFKALVTKDARFSWELVERIDDSANNIREVLSLKHCQ